MDKVESKNRNIEKNETFFKISKMLKSIYENNAVITESEMELLARDLEYSVNEGYSTADIISAVTCFWQRLLYSRERGIAIDDKCLEDEIDEIEVDSELARQWEIADEIIALLEINEKNAHALCRSFVDECNSYNAFVCLVTDFREYLTADELVDVFDIAEIFDKELVDCYRYD